MIRIVFMGRLACPAVYCDECHQMISDHVEGTAVFQWHGKREEFDLENASAQSRVSHVHNHLCLKALRTMVEGHCKGIDIQTQPLGEHLYWLCHNSEITPAMFKQLGAKGD